MGEEEMTTYNGWTNYATWRVNLEMFGGMTVLDFGDGQSTTEELSDCLKYTAESYIEETSSGVARDYALAFLSDVDWREIAAHMIDDYCEEEEKEE
jgi:hypothetical protein